MSSALELTVTETVDGQALERKLKSYFQVSGGGALFVRASADTGNLPQFLQLVGDAVAWLPLSIAAAAFLKRIADKAADASWDYFKRKFETEKEVKPLCEVVTILFESRLTMGERGAVIFGLNFPQPFWGTVVIVKEPDALQIAHALAKFVTKADAISQLMHDEIAAGRRPLGYTRIELNEDGSLTIHWIDQEGFALQERKLAD